MCKNLTQKGEPQRYSWGVQKMIHLHFSLKKKTLIISTVIKTMSNSLMAHTEITWYGEFLIHSKYNRYNKVQKAAQVNAAYDQGQ